MEAHDAEADGAVAHVSCFCGFSWVEVDVDDVIEGSDGDLDGFAEFDVIDVAYFVEV